MGGENGSILYIRYCSWSCRWMDCMGIDRLEVRMAVIDNEIDRLYSIRKWVNERLLELGHERENIYREWERQYKLLKPINDNDES